MEIFGNHMVYKFFFLEIIWKYIVNHNFSVKAFRFPKFLETIVNQILWFTIFWKPYFNDLPIVNHLETVFFQNFNFFGNRLEMFVNRLEIVCKPYLLWKFFFSTVFPTINLNNISRNRKNSSEF